MSDIKTLPRVTYSNINEDFSGVHAWFTEVLADFKANSLGKDHANLIGGESDRDGTAYQAPCPADTSISLGTFYAASPEAVNRAVLTAKAAYPAWRGLGYEARAALALEASNILEERKYEISAAGLFEVGKSRMESIGEVEEAIDIIRYYAGQLLANKGYIVQPRQANAGESTLDVLRPYGTFAVISPFNFPTALTIGMSICALLAGNTVVLKPSPMSGLTSMLIASCFAAAGIHAAAFNVICGDASTGASLTSHPAIDGIAFTGSNKVGMHLIRTFGVSGLFAKPVLAELGGKNPTYIADSANVETAVSGLIRSAFGLQGQKCSACSVAFVHESIVNRLIPKLVEAAANVKIGDPAEQETFMGAIINEASLKRYLSAVESAKAAGGTVYGGKRLRGGVYDKGIFVEPTIVTGLPDDHELHSAELFLPFVTVRTFTELPDAITRGNAVPYGLTAGVYTQDEQELQLFLETAEAGALYANRASGATTGAWPGVQTFCGWKGSGTGSKGGLGTWYLPQFMREQSHTIMR